MFFDFIDDFDKCFKVGFVIVDAAPLGECRTDTGGILFGEFQNAFRMGVELLGIKVTGEFNEFHPQFAPVFHGTDQGLAFGLDIVRRPAHDDDIFGESVPTFAEGIFALDHVIVTAGKTVGVGVEHIVPHVDLCLGGDAFDFLVTVLSDHVQCLGGSEA